jgi:hypothetical protein
MKDCHCLTHEGPHWQHIDAISKAQNHAPLEQMQRYREATCNAHDVAEVALYHGAFVATVQCYAEAELSRLDEKKQRLLMQEARHKLEQEEHARLAEKAQQIERENRESAIATADGDCERSHQ